MSADNTTPTTSDPGTTTPETSDQVSSFDWKTAAIAAGITLGAALLILAIVLLVKHIRKKKEEEKENVKEGEDKNEQSEKKEQDKKEEKTKEKNGEKKDVKSEDKGKAFENLPKTQEVNVVNLKTGVKQKAIAERIEGTNKYIIPRASIQKSIVQLKSKNCQDIDAAEQKVTDAQEKNEATQNTLNTAKKVLYERKRDGEQLDQFAKVIGGMGANVINAFLSNIAELNNPLSPAPITNQAAAITKEVINNAIKKEKENTQEDLTNMEPKVIKQEVKTSLEAANKAKEVEKGNKL